jgi:uncharacterized membrane protein
MDSLLELTHMPFATVEVETGSSVISTAPARSPRFWEIDVARGIAIVMMVIYHLVWDLSFFDIADIDPYRGFWRLFQRATASLFLLLVGVSIQLRAERERVGGDSPRAWRRQVRRALTVFGAGMLVTAVTWLFIPQGVVVFGILHFIGLAMLLAYPLRRLGYVNLLLAVVIFAAGSVVDDVVVPFPWLVWLGLMPEGFASVDYFPLLPWFGVVLIGLVAGGLLYRDFARRLPLPTTLPILLAPLAWLGRHSLPIYLIHQPALIALLLASGLVPLAAVTG